MNVSNEEMKELLNLLTDLLGLDHGLTDWEIGFLESLTGWNVNFTTNQAEKLRQLRERLL